jgi:DNA-binding NarL/FixJ family response regulator
LIQPVTLEILRLLRRDGPTGYLARSRHHSERVEKHIEHILLKLGVHSRAQAIALALQQDAREPTEMVSFTTIDGGRRREAVS